MTVDEEFFYFYFKIETDCISLKTAEIKVEPFEKTIYYLSRTKISHVQVRSGESGDLGFTFGGGLSMICVNSSTLPGGSGSICQQPPTWRLLQLAVRTEEGHDELLMHVLSCRTFHSTETLQRKQLNGKRKGVRRREAMKTCSKTPTSRHQGEHCCIQFQSLRPLNAKRGAQNGL